MLTTRVYISQLYFMWKFETITAIQNHGSDGIAKLYNWAIPDLQLKVNYIGSIGTTNPTVINLNIRLKIQSHYLNKS